VTLKDKQEMNDLMKQQSTDLGFAKKDTQNEETGLIASTEARAIAEVQAAYVIAKKFPRNQHESYVNILESCKRPFLAEQATYAYPRGSSLVTGPSIRLAECMAQAWGNLDCGVREISQSNGVSIAEAYAIDLQTNTRVTKVFHVPHVRDTKKGRIKLTDARDIYELVANQGSRRLRACILGILPGDVVEAAVNQCKKTMETGEVPLVDRIRIMVTKFDELGVKVEHLEKRLGHKLDATIPQEIVTLQGIYKAIKDGFSSREDFFEISGHNKVEAKADLEALLAEKNKSVKKEQNKDDKKPN
jgi:hypothetical protein